MALELKIISPSEDGFVKAIEWNHEEIKAYVAQKVADYKGLVYTEDQLPEAKKDRATLNKFKQAIEDKRKEIKRQCMAPYDTFEAQVKEIIAIIQEPIDMIGDQLNAFDEAQKEEKRKEIQEIFNGVGFGSYVTLDKVWNDKWLNKSYPLKQIQQDLHDLQIKIGNDVFTLHGIGAYSANALVIYEQTLDLNQALNEARRLDDIQKAADARLKAEKEQEDRNTVEAPKSPSQERTEGFNGIPAQTSDAVRRKKAVIEIVANENQFAAVNDFYKSLRPAVESVRIVSVQEV